MKSSTKDLNLTKIEMLWISNKNYFDFDKVKNKLILWKLLTRLNSTYITINNGIFCQIWEIKSQSPDLQFSEDFDIHICLTQCELL